MKKIKICLASLVLSVGLAVEGRADLLLGGNEVKPRPHVDTWWNFYLMDTNNPFNANGEVTTWEVYAGSTEAVQLVIYRATESGFSVVGRSAEKTPTVGTNVFGLATPIEVQAGDFIGLYYRRSGVVSFDLHDYDEHGNPVWDLGEDNLGGGVLFTDLDTGPEDATNFYRSTNRTYSVRATGIARIDVAIEIKPETLNLKGKGVFTAFVDLPEGYDEEDIDTTTLECEGSPVFPAATYAPKAMMADDGRLIVKFYTGLLDGVPTGDAVELAVTGKLTDGTAFVGSDTIRVISKGK